MQYIYIVVFISLALSHQYTYIYIYINIFFFNYTMKGKINHRRNNQFLFPWLKWSSLYNCLDGQICCINSLNRIISFWQMFDFNLSSATPPSLTIICCQNIHNRQAPHSLHTNSMMSYGMSFVSSKHDRCATSTIDLLHKSNDAPVLYPTMHHFVTEMCTCVHISVTKWCIMGYLFTTLWDSRDCSNTALCAILWYNKPCHHKN